MSRIIEFTGLPGSGKSSLARALLGQARRSGPTLLENDEAVRRCVRRRDDGRLGNLLKRLPVPLWEPILGGSRALAELQAFAGEHVPLLDLLFEALDRDEVRSASRQCIIYAFFKRCAERRLMDAHLAPDEGVVVEEGFARGLLTMLGGLPPGGADDLVIERYVQTMPAPFAVFWVDIDPEECAARLRRRPELPLVWAGSSDGELLAHLKFGRRCLESGARAMERAGIPVCRVSNAEGEGEAARRLVCEQGGEWAHRMQGA
jgi:hypothetical protein